MFGIPLHSEDKTDDEPTYVFCDNETAVKNTQNVESMLNKKDSSIEYHFNRFCVAAGIVKVGWLPSGENLAHAFTKRLSEVKRDYLFENWTY